MNDELHQLEAKIKEARHMTRLWYKVTSRAHSRAFVWDCRLRELLTDREEITREQYKLTEVADETTCKTTVETTVQGMP